MQRDQASGDHQTSGRRRSDREWVWEMEIRRGCLGKRAGRFWTGTTWEGQTRMTKTTDLQEARQRMPHT